jgi:hypothetical protein
MSQPPGLPLHAQKAITGQLLGWEALTPELRLLEHQGRGNAAEQFAMCIRTAAEEALDAFDNPEPLDSFLRRLADQLPGKVAAISQQYTADLAQVLTTFSGLVADFCAAPYDPLERLFAGVAQAAADFYGDNEVKVPPDLWHNTSRDIAFLGKDAKGLSFAPDLHLSAQTKFMRDRALTATVTLKVAPMYLEAEAISVLPRVLLHEYVAHVPQGPHSPERVHPDVNDSFAEGWMDYVAHLVHTAVLHRRGPHKALTECLNRRWLPFYVEAAERFFQARSRTKGRDSAAAARSLGVAAATLLHDLLRRLPETNADADKLMRRFSFELNTSGLDSTLRQLVVAEIHAALVRVSEDEGLVSAVRGWASGRSCLMDLCDFVLRRGLKC